MKNEQPKLLPLRKAFNEQYGELSEVEIQKEILFSHKITNLKLEKIRENTSKLVWFLIVVPFIIGVIGAFVAMFMS